MTLGEILARNPVALDLLRCIGVRYDWNAGTPSTPWPPKRADCSGFVQMALVHAGLYRGTEPDRRATASSPGRESLADICVATTDPQFGDIAIYPGHVMFCLGGEWVIGATGGDSTTHGDKPSASVQLHRFDYRRDFLVFGRLKPEHRLTPGVQP